MPAAEFTWWHRIAIQTPGGLTRAEVAILDAIAGYYRLLHERGNALAPSIEEMAESAKVRPVDVTTAIKRLAGALATAGAEDGPPI
jgi:hypothetical protein